MLECWRYWEIPTQFSHPSGGISLQHVLYYSPELPSGNESQLPTEVPCLTVNPLLAFFPALPHFPTAGITS